GAGDVAGQIAGRIRNQARFAMLLPRQLDLVEAGKHMPLPLPKPPIPETVAKAESAPDPAAKTEVKTETKSEAKIESKPESKPDIKPDPRREIRTATTDGIALAAARPRRLDAKLASRTVLPEGLGAAASAERMRPEQFAQAVATVATAIETAATRTAVPQRAARSPRHGNRWRRGGPRS